MIGGYALPVGIFEIILAILANPAAAIREWGNPLPQPHVHVLAENLRRSWRSATRTRASATRD